MKITCTQAEKENITKLFLDSVNCVFDPMVCKHTTCDQCIEASIEWEIKDGEKK